MLSLSIGMAHYRDYHGAYFTIQAIRASLTPAERKEIEFVVVDNSPGTNESQALRGLIQHIRAAGEQAKLVEMTSPIGTSPSRERIFSEATGEYVLVMDCHVLLLDGAIPKLIDYYKRNPGTRDIHSGPLIWDSLDNGSTHMNPGFRSLMYGKWGRAWGCECGYKFTVEEEQGKVSYRSLDLQLHELNHACPNCSASLPELSWPGHERMLVQHNFANLLWADEPFDVPGHGCGLFSCKRDAWPHFNEHARQFGGEEIWIHQKFVKRGDRSLCLPFLKWVHRFGHIDGIKYPHTDWNRIRNHVLEWNEIGWPLDEIHQHFVVDEKKMPEDVWQELIADPIHTTWEKPNKCASTVRASFGRLQPPANSSLDEMFGFLEGINRDLNEHMPKLKELAEMCEHVTEFSHRRESTVALLAGRPQEFVTYNTEKDEIHDQLRRCAQQEIAAHKIKSFVAHLDDGKNDSLQVSTIEPTDLLFIDTIHTAERLKHELDRHAAQVRRFIVLHDTQLHGNRGADGGPGLFEPMLAFMRANPEWSTVYHTDKQFGLTVYSRHPDDKPKVKPTLLTQAGSFLTAVTKYVAAGGKKVEKSQYEERMNTCAVCPQRNGNRCTVCGCGLSSKAAMPQQNCPLGKWVAVDLQHQAEPTVQD